jgi:hypothetical protein
MRMRQEVYAKGNVEVLASENCAIILTERSVEIKSA